MLKTFVFTLLLAAVACSRSQPPVVADAGAPPPPPPPPAPTPAPAIDAAADRADATDAPSGPARRAAHRAAVPAAPAGAGGIAGLAVTGSLPKAEAASILHTKVGAVRACYDKAHAQDPALHGRVSFKLTLDDRGRVALGEVVTSTLGGGDAEMCMVQALRTLKFPQGPVGSEPTISFQMTFGR